MRKPYPSDLTDAQWEIVRPLIPVFTVGRPREVDMREVVNAILYLNRSGCQWDMLPHDLPARSTVYEYFGRWRDDGTWQAILDALRQAVRVAVGRDKDRCREHREPDGQGDRDRRRSVLRRGQEDHRAEAPYRRGHVGLADRLRGDDRLRRRRDDRFRGAGPIDRGAPHAAGVALGRHEVPQPRAGGVAEGGGGAVPDRGGESPCRFGGVREAAPAVGGGADVRVVGSVSASQPGLRAVQRVEQG